MYKLKPSDAFTCCVKHVATSAEVSHVVEPLPFAGHEELKVSFTVRLAGKYSILLKTSSGPIADSPHVRMYLPGESQVCTRTHKHTNAHPQTYAHMDAHTRIQTHRHAHARIYVRTQMCMRAQADMCTYIAINF